MNKDRRRSSIHDITSVNSGDVSSPQGPITGQTNGTTAGSSSGKSNKQPAAHPGVGVYGPTTIGQPVGGPLVSAVGKPVNLPPPAHMAYGVRPPIPGQALPGVPGTYPMPHSLSLQRCSMAIMFRKNNSVKLSTLKQDLANLVKANSNLFKLCRTVHMV
nr:transcription factor DIVARICATA-like [Ipomoea batatas]